jgi:hypothetical protein
MDNTKIILSKLNGIAKSHRIQDLVYNVIKYSHERKILKEISSKDQNEILETLYEYSGINDDVGRQSAMLYAKITSENH